MSPVDGWPDSICYSTEMILEKKRNYKSPFQFMNLAKSKGLSISLLLLNNYFFTIISITDVLAESKILYNESYVSDIDESNVF